MKKIKSVLFFILTIWVSINLNAHVTSSHYYIDKDIDYNSNTLIPSSSTFHVYSHGRSGELLINGKWMNASEIAVFLKPKISHPTSHISHINIYGCEFAKGEKGLKAVYELEKNLGIEISASTNITGIDGDWVLEIGNLDNTIPLKCFKNNLQCSGVINLITNDNNGTFGTFSSSSTSVSNVTSPPTSSNFTFGSTTGFGVYGVLVQAGTNPNWTTYWGSTTGKVGNTTGLNTDAYLIYQDASTSDKVIYNTTFSTTAATNYNYSFDFANPIINLAGYDAKVKLEIVNSTGTIVASLVSPIKASGGPVSYSVVSGNVFLPIGNYSLRIKNLTTNGGGMIDNIKVLFSCFSGSPDFGLVSSSLGGTAVLNVTSNDIVGGVNAVIGNSGNSNVSKVGTWPTGISLDTITGEIKVSPNTPTGNYNLVYKLCNKNTPNQCMDVNVKVNVISEIEHPLLDNDGDGVNNNIDIDDDNDGVLDTKEQIVCSETCAMSTGYTYVSLNTQSTDSISGVLSTNGGSTIVTFKRSSLLGNIWDIAATNTGWPQSQFWCPPQNLTQNGWVRVNACGVITATFSKPVRNPRVSFGTYNPNIPIYFPHPVRVMTANAAAIAAGVVVGSYITQTPIMPSNTENLITVQYKGVYTSLSWDGGLSFEPGGWEEFNIAVDTVLPLGTATYVDSTRDFCNTDTDKDGIPNSFDLDSDGDGCSDANEATVASVTGVTMNNGSAINKVPNQTTLMSKAIVAGPYGANGFANSVETSSESGVYKSTYTYNIAIDSNVKVCCKIGTTTPSFLNNPVQNTCPDTTVNIASFVSSIPANSKVVVYGDSLKAGSPLPGNIAKVSSTYYVFFYDSVNNCYSLGSGLIVNIIPCCKAGKINPMVSQDTLMNSCPINSVDLTKLTFTTPIPIGTTVIYSLHNPPTISGDTFTTSYASSYIFNSKVFVMFYDNKANCYSPADSIITFVWTCPTPDTIYKKPTCDTCTLNVCAVNDDIYATNNSSTSFCGTPTDYTITGPTPTGCITATPNGSAKDTAKVCIKTCDTLLKRCDTSYIFIVPPTPKPDTIVCKSKCDTLCGVNDDILPTNNVTTVLCSPTGYTITKVGTSACYVVKADSAAKDTAKLCIVTCDTLEKRCDTTVIKIVPKTPSPDTLYKKPTCDTCTINVCAVNNDILATNNVSTSFCGTPTGYTITGPTPTGCITAKPNGSVKDTAKVCIKTCDTLLKRCDTSYIFIVPPTPTPDTITCTKCDTVCGVNDDILTTNNVTTVLCSPTGYTITKVGTSACYVVKADSAAKDTAKLCIVTCDTLEKRCDTTVIKIVPKTPSPDTLYKKPTCDTCTINVCAVNNDILTTNNVSTSFCGSPTDYTITGPTPTGCISAKPNGSVKDTAKVCIKTCDTLLKRCDTSFIFIVPPTPKPDTIVCKSKCDTICGVNDDILPTNNVTTVLCSPTGYTITKVGTSACYVVKADSAAKDTAKLCIVTCDTLEKRCDTTVIKIVPKTPSPDTVYKKPTCDTCTINVCAVNNDILATNNVSTSFCGSPTDYTITGPTATGCITATPNGSVKDTAKVCIKTCDTLLKRCDTSYIFIVPPTPKPDTIVCKSKCDTICGVNDDILPTNNVTTVLCSPTGYTITKVGTSACYVVKADSAAKDTAKLCIVTCDTLEKRCDTTVIKIAPKTPTPDTIYKKPTCDTCTINVCAVNNDILATNNVSTSFCGTPRDYTIMGPTATGCITATPNGSVKDTAKVCIKTCDTLLKRCDTSYIFIVPPTPKPDTIVCKSKCDTICGVNDDILPTNNVTTVLCSPTGYTITKVGTSACYVVKADSATKDTAKLCIVTCDTLEKRCDTTVIKIVPKTPSPDTVYKKPTCDTCTINVCAVNNDILATNNVSTSFCGTPTGYKLTSPTATGCISATPNGSVKDTAKVCIKTCDTLLKRCDTSYIFIVPPTPTPDTITCTKCDTVCGVNDDILTTNNVTTVLCKPTGYTVTKVETKNCVVVKSDSTAKDSANICLVTCDTLKKRCDTTVIVLPPATPTPDTVYKKPACDTCTINICAVNDDILATNNVSTSFCGSPTGYTVTGPTSTGCITAKPDGSVKDTAKVCIKTCDTLEKRCDTSYIFIVPPTPTPDTIVCKSKCDTICGVNDDILPTNNVTTVLCSPTGYTITKVGTSACYVVKADSAAKDTAKLCIVTCDTLEKRCDTTVIKIVPKTPSPDTLFKKPTCDTCTINVCAVNNDILATNNVSTSFCGTPTGYTITGPTPTGCITAKPNGSVKDTAKVCIKTCDTLLKRCDTSYIFIVPPTPTPDTITCTKCDTVCGVNDDILTTNNVTTVLCSPTGYTVTKVGTSSCFVVKADSAAKDTAKLCIVTCDTLEKRCDTTVIKIVPKTPSPDTLFKKPTCDTCTINVCAVNNDILATNNVSTSFCGTPTGYTITGPTPTGCITAKPNGSVKDTAKVCIKTCDTLLKRCDTSYVFIVPPTPTPDTLVCTDTCDIICAVNDDILTTNNVTTILCNPIGYTVTKVGTTACVVLTKNATLKDTSKLCIVTCDTLEKRCDTTIVLLPPSTPTPDTIYKQPACDTCSINVCAENDDILATNNVSTSFCGTPAGYTITGPTPTGCITAKPNGSVKDTAKVCIKTCDTLKKRCDTSYIYLIPPTPKPASKPDTVIVTPICTTCPVVACPVINDIDTSGGGVTYSSCATPSGYTETIDAKTGCVSYTATTVHKDPVYGCILICKNGVCDTTRVKIMPKLIIADTNIVTPKYSNSSIQSCYPYNDISKGGGITYTSCGIPSGYTESIDTATGCVTYVPTRTVTEVSMGCILICKGNICDTLYTKIIPAPIASDTVSRKFVKPTDEIVICPTGDNIDHSTIISYLSSKSSADYIVVGPDANGCYTYRLADTSKKVKDTQTFWIVVCSNGVCDTTFVRILPNDIRKLVLPNYFSPNGDGVNDFWDIEIILKDYPKANIQIYNIWGNTVWRANGKYTITETNNGKVWKGENQYTGDPLPDGVYYYVIELEPDYGLTTSGYVEIMRR